MCVWQQKLTLFCEELLLLYDWCFEAHISTVTGHRVQHGGQLRGTSGHQSLHTWGIETGHALALIQPQLASRVLHTLPLLKQGKGTFHDICLNFKKLHNVASMYNHALNLTVEELASII